MLVVAEGVEARGFHVTQLRVDLHAEGFAAADRGRCCSREARRSIVPVGVAAFGKRRCIGVAAVKDVGIVLGADRGTCGQIDRRRGGPDPGGAGCREDNGGSRPTGSRRAPAQHPVGHSSRTHDYGKHATGRFAGGAPESNRSV